MNLLFSLDINRHICREFFFLDIPTIKIISPELEPLCITNSVPALQMMNICRKCFNCHFAIYNSLIASTFNYKTCFMEITNLYKLVFNIMKYLKQIKNIPF